MTSRHPSRGPVWPRLNCQCNCGLRPTAIAKQLAKGIRGSDTDPLVVAVSGPSSEKTAQVIQDALKSTNKKSLPMLTLIFVGSEHAAKTLEADVKGIQAAFVYVRYP
jgi:hypothetical protein